MTSVLAPTLFTAKSALVGLFKSCDLSSNTMGLQQDGQCCNVSYFASIAFRLRSTSSIQRIVNAARALACLYMLSPSSDTSMIRRLWVSFEFFTTKDDRPDVAAC